MELLLMVEWKKMDWENPSELNKEYLTFDGNHIYLEYLYMSDGEVTFEGCDEYAEKNRNAQYYAEINSPMFEPNCAVDEIKKNE